MLKIVEMLRAQNNYLADRAAEEIEALQREVVRLQKALEQRPVVKTRHENIQGGGSG